MDFSKLNLHDNSKLFSGLSSKIPQITSMTSQPVQPPNMQMRDGGMVHIEEISAEEFLSKLYQSGENYHLGKTDSVIRVGGNVKIDSKKYHKKYGIIEDFEFEHSVIFMGENEENLFSLGECIVFLNCRFEKKLYIQNCKFERGETALGSFEPNSIEILGGYLKEISLDNCELHGILFSEFESEPLKIDHIDIKNCNFLTGSMSLKSTEVNVMCDINYNNFTYGILSFYNNKIFCGCRFSVNKNLSLHFYGKESIFEKPVFIYHGEYKSIDFNDVHFNDEVTLIACSIEEEIKLVGNTFEDRLWILSKDETDGSISNVTPDEIWIQNNKFQNGFKYNSGKNIVDSLTTIFSEKSSGVIEFEDVIFKNIEIMGNNFNNSLFFRDCLYTHLSITNFFNKALVSFNNNCPNHTTASFEELKIENSNLGNTEFYDFDFRVYNRVRIIDSRIDNIFVNGVEWFEPHQLVVDEEESDSKKILSQKREIYRQLKFAAEKQSDRITALQFKAREVQTHNELLGKNTFLTKKWFKHLGDIWSISLGKTNDHGQDWIKPIGYVLAFTLLFFYPLMISCVDSELTFWPINSEWKGLSFFWEKYKNYSNSLPELFYLARRSDVLFPEINSIGWFRLWDGLQRIILAFFIFQIVSAFRKFVK